MQHLQLQTELYLYNQCDRLALRLTNILADLYICVKSATSSTVFVAEKYQQRNSNAGS